MRTSSTCGPWDAPTHWGVNSRALRAVFLQIREHQTRDGAVGFPPGNAQNTVAMGPVFSSVMAVLILNAPRSRLVFDEDYRLAPLF